jgi:hypothetical protein
VRSPPVRLVDSDRHRLRTFFAAAARLPGYHVSSHKPRGASSASTTGPIPSRDDALPTSAAQRPSGAVPRGAQSPDRPHAPHPTLPAPRRQAARADRPAPPPTTRTERPAPAPTPAQTPLHAPRARARRPSSSSNLDSADPRLADDPPPPASAPRPSHPTPDRWRVHAVRGAAVSMIRGDATELRALTKVLTGLTPRSWTTTTDEKSRNLDAGIFDDAGGGTRTPTALRPRGPKPGPSPAHSLRSR